MSDFIKAFSFLNDNASLVLDKTETHMIVSGESVAIAILLGVPLGVFLGHIHRFSFLAINISNLGRALPSLAVLAVLLPFLGVGKEEVIIALVILAFPPILTNSYVAVDQVDADTVDAAKGMGLSPLQVLLRAELPLSLPLIFAGIRTSSVFVVATAALTGIFGGGGLGEIINNRESYGLQGVLGAAYVLIVLAFLIQIFFIVIERLVTPAGLRRSRSRRRLSRGAITMSGRTMTSDAAEEEDLGDDTLAAVGNK